MFNKLVSVPRAAWCLFAALAILAVTSAIIRSTGVVSPQLFLYVIQPIMALIIFGFTIFLTHGLQDRVRHRGDRAFLVGSVIAIWFVLYFLSGLATTYSDNSLVSGPRSIVFNIWGFGVVAFAIEYARHGLMMLAGRRHFIWFGTSVALVLAVQQMDFGLIPQTQGLEGFVKLGISDFVPAIASSFLLTYLAIAGGLPSMLVYRLGLVAVTILPPIIPKYDWYLRGVSLLLLSIATYMFMSRNQQAGHAQSRSGRLLHPTRANDIMSLLVMICTVLFVTGFFSYKPVTIVSNSMKPVYSRGSIVIIQKVNNPLDIEVGDIVQYKRTSRMITHRVIAVNEAPDGTGKKVFTTQGDNSPSKDPPVTEEQIVGVVRSQVPFIGYPTVWLREAST